MAVREKFRAAKKISRAAKKNLSRRNMISII